MINRNEHIGIVKSNKVMFIFILINILLWQLYFIISIYYVNGLYHKYTQPNVITSNIYHIEKLFHVKLLRGTHSQTTGIHKCGQQNCIKN